MLTSDELQFPELPMMGEWKEFDPLPEFPVLYHDGTPVARIPKQLKETIAVKEYKAFMCKKFDWSSATWDSIDWEIFKATLKQRPGHSVSLQKYLHGWLPVAQLVQHYGPDEITLCPDCHGQERQDHVLRCPSTRRKEIWNQCWSDFKTTLQDKTPDALYRHLITHLQRWIQDPNYSARISRVPQRFKNAARTQNAIGW